MTIFFEDNVLQYRYPTAPYFSIPYSFFGHDPVILLKVAGFSHPILLFRVGLWVIHYSASTDAGIIPVQDQRGRGRGEVAGTMGWNAAGQREEEAKNKKKEKKERKKIEREPWQVSQT